MTNGEIFAIILSEITGTPAEEVAAVHSAAMTALGKGRAKLDDELDDQEAQALLSKLRAEKDGIRLWLQRNSQLANPGDLQGTA